MRRKESLKLARFITGIITQGIIWWFENDEPPTWTATINW